MADAGVRSNTLDATFTIQSGGTPMSQFRGVSRRTFLNQTAAAGVAAAAYVPSGALGKDGQPPPSERIQVGLLGCGGMGRGNLSNTARYPDVVVTAACDVWKARREAVARQFKTSCKAYADFHEMLARKDVDAVIVATPPHWHALLAIAVCEAGKDLYLQKPMTLHLAESLAVRNAVRQHKTVCQVGTQIHAGENYRRVVEFIRAGNLGKVGIVRTFHVLNQGPQGLGKVGPATPPDGFDWETWLGPAAPRPFNPTLVSSSFAHCFFAISGGWTPGMAPHIIDLPIWALDLGLPTGVSTSGGRYIIDDDGDANDNEYILWQYPKLTLAWWSSTTNSYGFDFHGEPVPKRRLGIYFHGTNGTLYAGYGTFKVVPEGDRMKGQQPPSPSIPKSPGHEREWLDCITSRQQPSCSPEYHVKIDIPLVLAGLSLRLGRSIRFDPATEKIVGDAEAARLAKPEYRAPWKFPDQYLT
jgi:predicted dehydrogenase